MNAADPSTVLPRSEEPECYPDGTLVIHDDTPASADPLDIDAPTVQPSRLLLAARAALPFLATLAMDKHARRIWRDLYDAVQAS